MKVILKDNIKGVGKKDQILNVADGYAKNFLFPKKLAVPADTGNLNNLKSKQTSDAFRKSEDLKAAKELAERLSTIQLKITVKSGENGRLFGAITSKEIAENLKIEFGITIDKKKILLDESIKELGTTNVKIKLYEGVIGTLKVTIQN